jgi:hypothetical protein
LSPFQTSLGVQSGIEQLGQQPLTLGAGLGGQQAAYGAQAGRYTMLGAQAATPFQYQAASYNPYANILQGIGTNPYMVAGASKLFSGGGAGNVGGVGSTFNTGFYDPMMQQF